MFGFIDLDDVRIRLAALRQHLPGVPIHYAMNGYAEPDLVSALVDAAFGFEAASIRDIEQLAGQGVDLGEVTFTAAIKPVDDVAAAYEYGVRAFVAASFDEITKIATAAPGSTVYLAVVNGRMDAADLSLFARDLGLEPAGLRIHIGRALPCGHSDTSSLDQIGASIADARRNLPDRVGVVVVPDRYLVTSTARVMATVIGRADRDSTSWLFLNAGCHTGMFDAVVNSGRRRSIERADGSKCSGIQQFSLAGPTGDFADVIARGVELPSDTGLGDRLVFG